MTPYELSPTRSFTAGICLLLAAVATSLAEERADTSLGLTLPPVAYACPGIEFNVYFDNLVLTERPERYQFQVECALGTQDAIRWSLKANETDVGDHPWRIRVVEGDRALGEQTMTLRVVPRDAGAGRRLRLLIIGDSLTHATKYPAELARLMSTEGNPRVTLLGTHRPDAQRPEVAHEGYGGWTWERFVRHYAAEGDAIQPSSPFVFLADGKPQLDVARYIREHCGGEPPDFITFLLGINDCFSADPEDPAAIDARIDAVFEQAEVLIGAFRAAAPECKLGICLVPPPNARESGFDASYAGRYHRWGWRRIQHRLVQRQLEHFGNRMDEHLFLVPTQLSLDSVGGYPVNDAVHPNEAGYAQVAATIYCWLKDQVR